jgi:hypothetical protein
MIFEFSFSLRKSRAYFLWKLRLENNQFSLHHSFNQNIKRAPENHRFFSQRLKLAETQNENIKR